VKTSFHHLGQARLELRVTPEDDTDETLLRCLAGGADDTPEELVAELVTEYDAPRPFVYVRVVQARKKST